MTTSAYRSRLWLNVRFETLLFFTRRNSYERAYTSWVGLSES